MSVVLPYILGLCLLGCPIAIGAVLLRQREMMRERTQALQREDLLRAGASEEVATLLASDRKLLAIGAYRAAHGGLGLREAKAAVDALAITARAQAYLTSGTADHVMALVARGHTLRAARFYRQQTGSSLRQARVVVNRLGQLPR